MAAPQAGVPHLAERLDVLFRTVPRPGTSATWTNEAVAEALTERGVSVTAPYLSQMRTGRRFNPSAQLLAGIAEFFGVPLTYFFEEHERIADQLDSLARVRDAQWSALLARTHHLSEESQADLVAIMEAVLRVREGGETHGGDRTA